MNTKEDSREERIIMEVIVDAYDMEERAMGWFYYLDDKIKFPFDAECIAIDNRSPLDMGEKVTVLQMTNEGNWSQDMYAKISWKGRTFSVPLEQLKPLEVDDDTEEAIADWHYWKKQGYTL